MVHLRVYWLIVLLTAGGSPLLSQPSHQAWDQLLQAHVNAAGQVDYVAFQQDSARLQAYLQQLSQQPPQAAWPRPARLTYWINAYNAFTIQLILEHYPLASIRELEQPWDQPFISLGGTSYSLNDIEHRILRRRFDEPRIHFAVNCASVSCPPLLNRAYRPGKLEQQLEQQARRFINDPAYNRLAQRKISAIFDWYGEDFTRKGSLISYLNRYTSKPLPEGSQFEFLAYDWNLNGQ